MSAAIPNIYTMTLGEIEDAAANGNRAAARFIEFLNEISEEY